MVEVSCTKSDAQGVLKMVLYGHPNAMNASQRCRSISRHVGGSAYPIYCVQLAEQGSEIHFNAVGGG